MKITDEMRKAARAKGEEMGNGMPGAFVKAMGDIAVAGLEAAISASPAGPQCCMCGKKGLSTVEGDGGTECELPDGRWVCSAGCWERAVETAGVGVETPDFCYDPSDWESTFAWDDRDLIHGGFLAVGEIKKVSTLLRGPDKWVAEVPTTWDEDGDPDKTEAQWFDTEEAARAALKGDEQ